MSLRKILIAAAIVAPLALSPIQASAQQGRGAEAREQAHQHGGQTVTQLPPGIAQKVERGGDVPEGIARRYSQPEPEPAPEPDTGTDTGTDTGSETDPTCAWGPPMPDPDGTWWTTNSCTGERMQIG